MNRATSVAWAHRGVAAALGLALLGVGAFRCGNDGQSDQAVPARTATAPGQAPSPGQARYLTGIPMSRPTHLRLLVPHWLLDIDAVPGTSPVPVGVTGWLPVPGREPLLIQDATGPEEFGELKVTPRPEPRLPGAPRVLRLTGPALARVAASGYGGGLWVTEYHERTRCVLRLLNLVGADRLPPRQVACGTTPIGETADGLWVEVGPDALAPSAPWDHHAVLLDPATLAERARFPRVVIVDDHRVVVFTDPSYDAVELRDLATTAWLHVPSMPAYASLKRTSLAWAQDGRLVLLGEFAESGPLLVTWRPGEPALSLLPYQRPPTPPDQPADDRIHVLPAPARPFRA